MHRYLLTIILILGLRVIYAQPCVSCDTDAGNPINWIGDESSDWNDALNWEGNVLPTSSDDAVIDSDLYTNPPIISANSTFVPRDVFIQDDGVLTVQANLVIEDDFLVRSGGLLLLEAGTIESDDDFNLCAGGNIEITDGTLNNMPAGGSGILRICVDTPSGQPLPTIVISGGSLITTTVELPDGFTLADFLTITGDGSFTGDGDTILPVELTSFTGRSELNSILLQWGTATEINNDRFEVLRSGDGHKFETIGIVSGSGTTNTRQRYEFHDRNPLPINYYRLKQIDFDGTFEYFSIIKVDHSDSRSAYRARYVAEERLFRFSSDQPVDEVVIYGTSGRVIFHGEKIDAFDISTSSLPAGVYLLKVVVNSVHSTEKLMIRR